MNKYYTYLIIDPRNNKPFYVGKGVGNRMTKHERTTKLGKMPNNNKFLYNKIRKILSLGFSLKYKQPIKNVSEDIAFKWEIHLIKCLRKKGYILCNISNGGIATRGHLGKKHSKNSRLKMSETRMGMFTLQWFIEKYGNDDGKKLYDDRSLTLSKSQRGIIKPPITEETRMKLIQSHTGKIQSQQTIEKRRLSMIGKNLGRVASEECRKKMSLTRLGMPSPMRGKFHSEKSKMKMKQSRMKQYSLLSPINELVNIICLKDFCKNNNLNYGNMNSVANGHRKSHRGWRLPL